MAKDSRVARHRAPLAVALSICFALPGRALAAPAEPDSGPPSAEAKSRTPSAEDLYYEGSARYSAADYEGAIASFTEALKIATRDGQDYSVRGALLMNLARARTKAFDVTGEVVHLRAAKEIYDRVVREAPSAGYPADDVAEAKRESKALEARIASSAPAAGRHDDPAPAPVPPVPPSQSPAAPAATPVTLDMPPQADKKRLGAGIALVSVGSVLVASGAGFIGWGATFKRRAEDDVGSATGTAANTFIDDEARKGKIWMGVGAGVAALGMAGLITGAVLVARHRKASRTKTVAPAYIMPGPGGRVVLGARF